MSPTYTIELDAKGNLVKRAGPARLSKPEPPTPQKCEECGSTGPVLVSLERVDKRGFTTLCGVCLREILGGSP